MTGSGSPVVQRGGRGSGTERRQADSCCADRVDGARAAAALCSRTDSSSVRRTSTTSPLVSFPVPGKCVLPQRSLDRSWLATGLATGRCHDEPSVSVRVRCRRGSCLGWRPVSSERAATRSGPRHVHPLVRWANERNGPRRHGSFASRKERASTSPSASTWTLRRPDLARARPDLARARFR